MSADDFASPRRIFKQGAQATVLFEENATVETVWFLDSGVGSIITQSPEGSSTSASPAGS